MVERSEQVEETSRAKDPVGEFRTAEQAWTKASIAGYVPAKRSMMRPVRHADYVPFEEEGQALMRACMGLAQTAVEKRVQVNVEPAWDLIKALPRRGFVQDEVIGELVNRVESIAMTVEIAMRVPHRPTIDLSIIDGTPRQRAILMLLLPRGDTPFKNYDVLAEKLHDAGFTGPQGPLSYSTIKGEMNCEWMTARTLRVPGTTKQPVLNEKGRADAETLRQVLNSDGSFKQAALGR